VPKEITNSIGMKLVLIPAGEFMMGLPDSASGSSGEKPQHRVRITKPFYIGATEVTQWQYEKVMGENTSYLKESPSDAPVECVSWDDAREFCRKLSELATEKRAGRLYRLPTEAEWEYACRAGSTTKYCYGDDESRLGDYAWYSKNSNEKKHQVGRKKPNAWGLYDMHGNVAEWCEDRYDYQYYANSPTDDPLASPGGERRVYRGGGWPLDAEDCRSARREYNGPETRFNCLGLRVATAPLGTSAESVGLRTWTDATGRYRVEAELIDFADEVVHLRKEDDRVIAVPLEKLSLADQRFLEHKSTGDGSQRDGLLVETGDGLYFVDLEGKTEPFAKARNVIVGRPAVQGGRVFVLRDGVIREFDPRGKLVREIAITNLALSPQEKNGSRLFTLSQGGFALLSCSGWGPVYFIDDRGAWRKTVKIPRPVSAPNWLGMVADGGLLVSNIHQRDVMRVDLKTYEPRLFMRSDRSLGPIAFDAQRDIYYVCSGGAIHGVTMKGKRGLPNVSQAAKITTVKAHFQTSPHTDWTIQPRFMSGIVLDGKFVYLTVLPYGCIVKVNVTTGEAEGFVHGLTHPNTIVRLKEPN
jgi:formylglycine-generating enzyme required for sulfatase activity